MRTIEINTTQNVTIQYELAPLRDRAIAFFIDLVIMGFGTALFAWFLTLFINPTSDAYTLVAFLIIAPFVAAYALVLEVFNNGQSWGKRALGIKVIKLNGKVPSLSDYFLRWTFRLIDIYLSVFAIGSILISSSEKSQRLGDILAATTVIRLRPNMNLKLNDILKINSLQNYQPKYPDVVRLTEDDMLLVKSMITRVKKYPNPAHTKALDEMILKLMEKLNLVEVPPNKIEFLNTLISDYIVLTR